MPVKMASSYNTILQEGGKLEDCRQLIKFAIKENLDIPIRDLRSNKIISFFKANETTSYSKIAFWLSYQLAIEYTSAYLKAKQSRNEYLHSITTRVLGKQLFPNDKIRNFMNAKILHIQEPLKQRNLTKSTSELTWFLTPGGKMLQGILSKLPEHSVGLKLASDAWKFQQRIHPNADGGFIFKGDSVQPSVFVFSDWVEATDNIHKLIGFHHLKSLMEYSGFPMAYGRLILQIILCPQPVEEVLLDYSNIKILSRGFIRNGFMMGNPITKPVLHLLHVSELHLSKKYCKEVYKIDFRRHSPNVGTVTNDINLMNYLDHR
jgi:hypothetical protein